MYTYILLFISGVDTGVELNALCLLGRCCTTWAAPTVFLFYFLSRVLCFAQTAQTTTLFPTVSAWLGWQVHTSMPCLIGWQFAKFLPGLELWSFPYLLPKKLGLQHEPWCPGIFHFLRIRKEFYWTTVLRRCL
jgi:hypothetical protein